MTPTFPKAIALHVKEVDDQVLVHDERNHNIHVLNTTAAFILNKCDGTQSIDQIVDAFEAGDVSKEQIRREVTDVIEQFRAIGLLSE